MSGKSLDVARARFGNLADFTHFNGATLPFPSHRFDVAFSACVFHHISVAEHVPLLSEIQRTLREHGTIAIFEHNPINPLTVCGQDLPDENARLISSGTMLDGWPGRLQRARTALHFLSSIPAQIASNRNCPGAWCAVLCPR